MSDAIASNSDKPNALPMHAARGWLSRALDSDIFHSFRRSKLTMVAAAITVLFFLLAIFASALAVQNPHVAVTFIPLACSGARIARGLLLSGLRIDPIVAFDAGERRFELAAGFRLCTRRDRFELLRIGGENDHGATPQKVAVHRLGAGLAHGLVWRAGGMSDRLLQRAGLCALRDRIRVRRQPAADRGDRDA